MKGKMLYLLVSLHIGFGPELLDFHLPVGFKNYSASLRANRISKYKWNGVEQVP